MDSAELLTRLTDKDSNRACAEAARMTTESREDSRWYPYLEDFADLLRHKNSLVRNRAAALLCANARWDAEGRLEGLLGSLLALVTDEKPITARTCIQALPELGAGAPALVPRIRAALARADLSGYRDSMRPLLEKDIAEALTKLPALPGEPFPLDGHSAVLYGTPSDHVWLFIHGKCGCKEEAAAFADIACPMGAQVLAIDLPEHGARQNNAGFDPWHVVPELQTLMACAQHRWKRVGLRANSIGAWFSLLAFADTPPARALLVSPVLDMEALIIGMMTAAGVDETRLERVGTISTDFGESLSWQYLQYARAHPVSVSAPASLLYADNDGLTAPETAAAFAKRFACELTVMPNGEHWFHTPAQLAFLRAWERPRAIL